MKILVEILEIRDQFYLDICDVVCYAILLTNKKQTNNNIQEFSSG